MNAKTKLDAILARNRLIPVLTIEAVDHAVPLARALVEGGITALEITLRTPVAAAAAERIQREVPEAIVGLGTVRSAADVALAAGLGAQFVVSPGTTSEIYDAVATHDLPFLPGVATATEVLAALQRGHRVVKLFPASVVGGIAAIKALAGPFPEVRFCPTGGVTEGNADEWLSVPEIVAVGGSWLAPADRIRAADWAGIRAIAARSLAAIARRTS
jgi:2-dehydro-3-deoxyphosphogluconate aldolase/(4S)-4-hydroxy-2-oxoglutarate aldolase